MPNPAPNHSIGHLVAGLAMVASSTAAGGAIGLLWVRLFAAPAPTGWDAIADALGGVMLGGVIGLLIGAWMARGLPTRVRWEGTILAALLAVGTLVSLAVTAPQRAATADTDTDQPTDQSGAAVEPVATAFRVNARLAHSRQRLAEVAPAERPLPFTESSLAPGADGYRSVGWGPAYAECTGEANPAETDAMLAALRELEADSYCRTPADDLVLAFSWSVDGRQGRQSMDAGCLETRVGFSRLVTALQSVGDRVCPGGPS
jgi:hypothetical protein